MKKKLLAALLALGMLASLTACGGKQKTQQDAAADGDTGYADSITFWSTPTMCPRMCWPPLNRSTAFR